jgi:hypothetical protein
MPVVCTTLYGWWYSSAVTTAFRRYQITATEDVRAALAEAERVWPGEPKSKLLTRLIVSGAERLTADTEAEACRLSAMTKYASCYPVGYLDDLRAEWEA